MKNQNITFQQFLEKIKTIDVGELLEKAKTIKVEDFKSIKLSDLKEITKSNYFSFYRNYFCCFNFSIIFYPIN